MLRPCLLLSLSLTLASLLPEVALGQAWLPPRGEGSVFLHYTGFYGGDHVFPNDSLDGQTTRGYTVDGDRLYMGDETSHLLTGGLEFGLHDRFAISGSLAWITTNYDGRAPVNLAIDDGYWHPTFQDAAVGVRFMALKAPVVVTPFVRYAFPITDYESDGHAAQGRGLSTLTAGAAFGFSMSSLLRSTYFQGRYGYGADEAVGDLEVRRSELAVEVGTYATNWLLLRFMGSFLTTHGGLPWISEDPGRGCVHCPDATNLDANQSDVRYARLGLGGSFRLGRRVSLFVAGFTTVEASNTIDADFLMAGTRFFFKTPWARPSMFLD